MTTDTPPSNLKLQTRLREIAESLLCREGSGHYCPNCGNTTFDAAMSLKLLADQIGAPVETFGKEPWRVALPKITEQHTADFIGYRSLMEFKGSKWEWTQDAVDFACMLQGVRQEAMRPEEPAREHLHWCAVRIGKSCNCHADEIEKRLAEKANETSAPQKAITCTCPGWMRQSTWDKRPHVKWCTEETSPMEPDMTSTKNVENKSSNLRSALEQILAKFKEADEECYCNVMEWEAEARKWKVKHDMYGCNFHQGMAAGANWVSMYFFRVQRELEALIKQTPDETTTSRPYRVRLLKDIFDDGQDHHPPGYIARKGDVVIVISIQTAVVSHHETGPGFVVHDGELEVMRPEEPTKEQQG